jgi:hypothetical protein
MMRAQVSRISRPMASLKKTPVRVPRSTRSTITIERLKSSYETSMLGALATQIMATVDGVSAVRIEDEYIDLAMLSYVWATPGGDCAGIDRTLWSNGMRRVG